MKKIGLLFVTALALISISAFTMFDGTMREPTGISFKTGSPYDLGASCNDCHSGGATIPTFNITSSPAFANGNTYAPGTTYTISVIPVGSYPQYGFGLEILNSNTTKAMDAGTFGGAVTNNCKKVTTSGKPTNMEHKSPTAAATATFSFTWTAPSSGTAYIYCCVNGVDGNGRSGGDHPAVPDSLILTPNTTNVAILNQPISNINVFPNPASERTALDYTLLKEVGVKIEMYDLSGRKEVDLIAENQVQGEHHEIINLSGIKSGVHLVVIKAGDKTNISKLIVN